MVRPALLFVCLATILTVAGCANPAPHVSETSSSLETTLSSEVATQFATMDEAVRALVDRAEHDDVAYFAGLTPSSDETHTRYMMELVMQSDMVSTYRSRIETSSD
ncbi:MAG: hypothetical protein CVT67_11825 [Actinobacteria bacterium HGW-Actinobacteria-7]|jgi:hypothetical protein|nr:MAG: hypothetical protein CVT67_11825 [Actinobacteria bacterium HGW-Actinobacteria-7]